MLKSQTAKALVAARVMGGLGNQLFAYATGRALAHRLGAPLVLDATRRMAGDRPFLLDRYPIRARVVFDAPAKMHARYFKLPGKIGAEIADRFHAVVPRTTRIDGRRLRVIEEGELFAYDTRFDRLTGSVYLKGWWQSFRYFAGIADLLRDEIVPAAAPRAVNRQWLDRIGQANSVAVHVRRGDYVGTTFGVCPTSYYVRAVELMRQRLQNPVFFVFSDDLAWCREHLAIADAVFVDANNSDDPVDELRLMASCRHHVIANSTFSWWSAWLARHPAHIVVAPRPWLLAWPTPQDLLPSGWIQLSSSAAAD